jgi:hypothetical protein
MTRYAGQMGMVTLLGILLALMSGKVGMTFATQQVDAKSKSSASQPRTSSKAQATTTIKRVFVKPVNCKYCNNPEHGDVIVVWSNGKQQKITKSGMCTDVKLAPDKRTIGWLEIMHLEEFGEDLNLEGVQSYALFIYRDGRILRRFGVGFNCHWRFRNRGKKVAVAFQGVLREGPWVYRLYDVNSGKLLAEYEEEEEKRGKPPSWVGDLLMR